MAQLELSNIINISVSQTPAGIGALNTSNLAVFTAETGPVPPISGTPYKIYLSPDEVATDFGTDSNTYKMAVSAFSQSPNILANNGYLVAIPTITKDINIILDTAPSSGTLNITFPQVAGSYFGFTESIAYNATTQQIQTALRSHLGYENVVVQGDLNSQNMNINFKGCIGNYSTPFIASNTLNGGSVNVTLTELEAGETLEEAILRTKDIVQYFGIMASSMLQDADVLASGAVVQTLDKMLFIVSRDETSVDVGGLIDLIKQSGLYKTRGLGYFDMGVTIESTNALKFLSAYAGRGLSTNFSGSNTTQTMQLKDLAGIVPCSDMNQTLFNKCMDAGADTYASIQGIPKVMTSGANKFFDDVYNLLWFVTSLKVAGFNVLAQASTKIPQTENGVSLLKSAYRQVCEQAISNQYVSSGTWTSPTTFGNLNDFLANISQRGYYIYSSPIAQQSPVDRAARKAPLIQIAIKEAGAIHSSNVIVNVNV